MKKQFLVNRAGKDFVLYAGLLDQAHAEGLKRITTKLLQAPTPENGQMAIVWAEVETAKGVFSGLGDATPANVGKMVASHLLRMAETRSKARALRDAINVGTVALEELGESDGAEGEQEHPDTHLAADGAVAEGYAAYGSLAARMMREYGIVPAPLSAGMSVEALRGAYAAVKQAGMRLHALSGVDGGYIEEMRSLHEQLAALDPGSETTFRAPATLDELRAYIAELRTALAALEAARTPVVAGTS